MKRILLIICVWGVCIGANAQEKHAFRKGYRGDVSMGGLIGINKDLRNDAVSLSTTHGYSYGDGFYIGAEAGVNILFAEGITIPVLAVGKYNFIDYKISPFVDCRIGTEALIHNKDSGIALVASPGFGIDYRRLIIRAAYICEAGRFTENYHQPSYSGNVTSLFKSHSFQIKMGISF